MRVRPGSGLVATLGVRCRVDPDVPEKLWIEWDAAHAEHEPAREQRVRVDREIARRSGKLDHVLSRVSLLPGERYKPGERIDVRVDAADPGAIALAS